MKRAAVFPAVLLCAVAALAAQRHRTVWDLGEFTWVRLEAVEKGAEPNDQPAQLAPEALRKGLADLKYQGEPLFAARELDGLMKALVEAFGEALPGEDLLVLSNNRRGGSFLNAPTAVTARLFVKGGQVNVIINDARLNFIDRYRADAGLPTFTYGSRTAAGQVALTASLPLRRADWAAFPAVPRALPAPMTPTEALTSIVAAPRPAAPDQENRLRALKRLRDENLITEEEYQKKRKEILDTL